MMNQKMSCLSLTWGQLVIVLGFMLAFLQMFHIFLLNQLEARNSTMKKNEVTHLLRRDVEAIYPIMHHSIESSHIMDSSGVYRIVYDVMQSASYSSSKDNDVILKKYGVTLVTHCSINHVHHLINLSHQWQGPISVAIFIPQEHSSMIIQSLLALHYCLPRIRHFITIHLICPLTQPLLNNNTPYVIPEISDCHDFREVLDTMVHKQLKPVQNYVFERQKYPNNLLRNTAARFIQTDYMLVSDIDIVPSPNLFRDFLEFARRNSFASETGSLDAQMVYVVPVFELQHGARLPEDKQSLLQLWEQGQIRPFYYELCWKCQKHTDYDAWRNLSLSKDLRVQYEVTWKDPWEPFYIGPRHSLPSYDERFKQYGFNRISQVCETHIAGFRFAVLNNVFLTHLGFKTQESYHSRKDLEQEQNRQLFRRFKEELKTKYPESTRRCY